MSSGSSIDRRRWLRRWRTIRIVITSTGLIVGELAPNARIHNVHEHGQQHEYHGHGEASAGVAAGNRRLSYASAD